MSKSELTKLELSGTLRKLSVLDELNVDRGIIGIESSRKKRKTLGLSNFARGAYNEVFGLDSMNKVIALDGVKAVSAVRTGGVATFSVVVTSVFDDRRVMVDFPHKEF